MIWLTEEGREKGCDGRYEHPPKDLPLLHGRWTGGVADAMEGQARRDPLFYTWWFVKRKRRKEDAGGETQTEGMLGKGEGAQPWDGVVSRSREPGRQAGSVGGVRRSHVTKDAGPRAQRPCKIEEEEKEKGTTAEGSIWPPPGRTT